MNLIFTLFQAGWASLLDYLSAHVLFCLVPAFFLAGALTSLVPSSTILQILGEKANKIKSYLVASVGGYFVEVCSCTILPLFAGIWQGGAGFGPAITLLYAGPAVNVVATFYTGSLLGWDFAIARTVLSIFFAILTGVLMARFFKKDKMKEQTKQYFHEKKSNINPATPWFFLMLLAILLVGTIPIFESIRVFGTVFLVLILFIFGRIYFSSEELKGWLHESFKFIKDIFPTLLVGVFFAGVLRAIIPSEVVVALTGKNTILANLIGVLFGVFAYFPALVEVPMAKTFMDLGMHRGPLLAYLIADPVISLQTILVINKLVGRKETLAYVALIVIESVLAGWIFGMFV